MQLVEFQNKILGTQRGECQVHSAHFYFTKYIVTSLSSNDVHAATFIPLFADHWSHVAGQHSEGESCGKLTSFSRETAYSVFLVALHGSRMSAFPECLKRFFSFAFIELK